MMYFFHSISYYKAAVFFFIPFLIVKQQYLKRPALAAHYLPSWVAQGQFVSCKSSVNHLLCNLGQVP